MQRKVTPEINLPVVRSSVAVSVLPQEYNTITLARGRTQTTESGV